MMRTQTAARGLFSLIRYNVDAVRILGAGVRVARWVQREEVWRRT
jgi:hypothetical protein